MPAVTEPLSLKTGRSFLNFAASNCNGALAKTFTISKLQIIDSDWSDQWNREAYSIMFLMGVSNIALFCEVPSSYSLRSPVQYFRVRTQIVMWLTCIDGRLHASGLEYTLALQ